MNDQSDREISDRPTRRQRDMLASRDDRNEKTRVATTPTGASQSGYAYHHVDRNGDPICGAGGPDTEFELVTIHEAQKRHKSPCRMCDRIVR
jgi:hypothetical protein